MKHKIQKERTCIWIKPKHGVYFDKNNTSMYELTLELKNKLKTQAR